MGEIPLDAMGQSLCFVHHLTFCKSVYPPTVDEDIKQLGVYIITYVYISYICND